MSTLPPRQRWLLTFMIANRIIAVVALIIMYELIPGSRLLLALLGLLLAIDSTFLVRRIARIRNEADRKG